MCRRDSRLKIRVTIDLDQAKESMNNHFSEQSMQLGVHGCDKEGAYHMFYHNRTDLVVFKDVEVIEE